MVNKISNLLNRNEKYIKPLRKLNTVSHDSTWNYSRNMQD